MPITYLNRKAFFNGMEIDDVQVDGIDPRDYPDFCDAYIESATLIDNGEPREATDAELDEINNDSDFVYEQVEDYLY